jgi:hypothetical protein
MEDAFLDRHSSVHFGRQSSAAQQPYNARETARFSEQKLAFIDLVHHLSQSTRAIERHEPAVVLGNHGDDGCISFAPDHTDTFE